jgi:hypothetical protein
MPGLMILRSIGESHLGLGCKFIELFQITMYTAKSVGSAYSTLVCTTPEAHLMIALQEHHKVRPNRNIGTCSIDCSTLHGTQSE